MAKIKVNNIWLAYETMGDGTPIVFTPGGFFPRDYWAYLQAGRFSKDYKVLLWDRRNTGMSDIGIEDSVSEWHLWTDDLHNLLNALDMSPAYLVGGSAGNVFSLLMAHLYPEDLKGLILHNSPTNNPQFINAMAYARYFQFADVAESKGMLAVIDFSTEAWVRVVSFKSDPNGLDSTLSWIAESIAANPGNRERLLSMDSNKFAAVLRKWGSWGQPERFHLAQLPDERVELIRKAGMLHDIGKIGIPDSILFKPGALTHKEFAAIKEHPVRGAEILEVNSTLRNLGPIIRYHHEHYDGSGYPDGLQGDKIPYEARILCLADSIQAMLSDRPYRKGLRMQDVISEVKENAGSQFDPEIAKVFLDIMKNDPAAFNLPLTVDESKPPLTRLSSQLNPKIIS